MKCAYKKLNHPKISISECHSIQKCISFDQPIIARFFCLLDVSTKFINHPNGKCGFKFEAKTSRTHKI